MPDAIERRGKRLLRGGVGTAIEIELDEASRVHCAAPYDLQELVEQQQRLIAAAHPDLRQARRLCIGDQTLARGLALQLGVVQTDEAATCKQADVDFHARAGRQTGAQVAAGKGRIPRHATQLVPLQADRSAVVLDMSRLISHRAKTARGRPKT